MKRIIVLALCICAFIPIVHAEKVWVDMGLPSGTLWASEPEEGFYSYSEAMEQFGTGIPTKWQWQELMENCCLLNAGDKGLELKSKNGSSITIPFHGWIFKNGKPQNKENGYYRVFNTHDEKKSAWYVLLDNAPTDYELTWTYKESYKMSVLLVNK